MWIFGEWSALYSSCTGEDALVVIHDWTYILPSSLASFLLSLTYGWYCRDLTISGKEKNSFYFSALTVNSKRKKLVAGGSMVDFVVVPFVRAHHPTHSSTFMELDIVFKRKAFDLNLLSPWTPLTVILHYLPTSYHLVYSLLLIVLNALLNSAIL